MKYIITINQKKAIKLNLTLDEAILITCIHDLMPLNSFKKNENNEVWVNHDLFRKEYPLLQFGKTTLFKKMSSLVERGFLTRTIKKAQSKTMVFYGLTEKSEFIFTDSQVHNLNFTGSQNEPAQVHNLNFTGSQNEPNQYTNYPNTNNQDTIINKNLIKENSNDNLQAKEVLEYLVFKTGKTYKPTKSNLTNINGRLGDGYSVDDCKRVIDNMYLEWHGETANIGGKIHNCDDWLNPTTLFKPTKFDDRLNKKPRELTTKDLAKTMTFEEPPEGFVF